MTRGPRLAATVVTAAIALTAIGCGDDEEPATTTSTEATTTAATGPTGAEGASESSGSAEIERIEANLADDGWKTSVEFDESDYTLSDPPPVAGIRVQKSIGALDAEIDVELYESPAEAQAEAESRAKERAADDPDHVETLFEVVGSAMYISWPTSDDDERAAFEEAVEVASAG